jgi:hypothetical protein
VSGVIPGVTTVPPLRVTEAGIPRHRWVWSHQYPSTLSKEWFSRYKTTTCLIGTALAGACDPGAPSTTIGSVAAASTIGSNRLTIPTMTPCHPAIRPALRHSQETSPAILGAIAGTRV